MVTEISRLSPYSIANPLARNKLYREIRNGQMQNNGWTEYKIRSDERICPELAAYRVYGSKDMKWIIIIAAGLDDIREALREGALIKLPPTAWIRHKILYYQGWG